MPACHPSLAALLFLLGALGSAQARAAETYHTCAGFIDTVPATITTQGVWCLRHDLSTAIASGNAITIATNNVTIDCNEFKLGGLAGGPASAANGIRAVNRQNATVRRCNIRGFHHGIWLQGGGGHRVEDNRLDNNLLRGINTDGDGLVRRNVVNDTGGATGAIDGIAIVAAGEISGNTISGVFADAAVSYAHGIFALGAGSRVQDNRIGGLMPTGGGHSIGIYVTQPSTSVTGNNVAANQFTPGYGIYGNGGVDLVCAGNNVAHFEAPYVGCAILAADNIALP